MKVDKKNTCGLEINRGRRKDESKCIEKGAVKQWEKMAFNRHSISVCTVFII